MTKRKLKVEIIEELKIEVEESKKKQAQLEEQQRQQESESVSLQLEAAQPLPLTLEEKRSEVRNCCIYLGFMLSATQLLISLAAPSQPLGRVRAKA
jgi:hypothetical protein